jgi:UDP-glucose 4-epimerase
MSILVTGAAGFIGSHLCKRLIDNGEFVIGVDNFKLGNKKNIEKLLGNKNFSIQEIDAAKEGLSALNSKSFSKIKEIWHFAASSDIATGINDYREDFNDTFLTTVNVCRFAELNDIKKIYFSSSGAVYGPHEVPIREDFPCTPISYYGTFKLASESFLSTDYERFLDKVIVYRFANIIGSNATHGVILDFVKKLKNNPEVLNVLGDGSQQKPYLHISELIDGMLFINEKIESGFEIFNLGPNDSGTSVKKIAEGVVNELNLSSEIIYGVDKKGWVGDIPKVEFDNKKVYELGWKPNFSSNESVNLAIKEIISEIF